jgi:transposase
MDTTSLYFEGAGGQTLGRHGFSKDHRPDLRQMILAVLIDGDGGRYARRCGRATPPTSPR